MRKFIFMLPVIMLLGGLLTTGGNGASPPEVMSELVVKAGQTVWLFHSGTPEVRKAICPGEVLPVYREVDVGGDRYKVEEVGKVKVLSYAGRNYFEARVVSGSVKVGDVATKNAVSCMVIAPRRAHRE